MRVYKLKPLSLCDTNSYIVASEKNNAVLIDAPAEADYILEQLDFYNVDLKKILLTHGHFDHIGAVADLAAKTGCEVCVDIFDKKKLSDENGMLANFFMVRDCKPYMGEVTLFDDGDVIELDELEFRVMHTPGHTSGSVCFLCGDSLFTGDTLFSRSCGRTDMPDGDPMAMRRSLAKLYNLSGDYIVYPGHMNTSTLDEEKRLNSFLRDYSGDF